jgi:SWI/SNF-related matrix-associated actin-dependent regulator 1 of chromatin subfamily A
MSRISVRARVVNVRPRGDDTFGVTLGPGPDVFWFCTPAPPKLGELVLVKDAEAKPMRVGGRASTVTLLEGGEMTVVPDPFTRRVVAPEWVRRAHQIMRRPLMPYQAEGAGWMAWRLATGRGSILGDDPGLGKTAQVLSAVASVGATPAIVVCPPSVKHNWVREGAYLKPRLKFTVVSGGKGVIPSAHVVVVNYDILRQREQQLVRLGAKTIIFDEAHNLKEPQPTLRHRAAVATRIAKRIGRPILLTGTVLLNRPHELWRLLHIIDPRQWDSYAEFKKRYCTSPDAEEKKLKLIITKHGQAKRLDELRALTEPYMLRRQTKRVLKAQLPPKSRRRVLLTLEEIDRRNYLAAEKDVVAWLRGMAGDARAMRAKRGQAVVKLNMLRRIAAIGKLRRGVGDFLRAWFEEDEKPLVIFAYHKQVLAGTEMICRKLGLRVSTISGQDTDKKRQQSVDQFSQGFSEVFLAPIKSAGIGINLQERCSDILCIERLWTPSLMTQAEGRCHRIGQRNPVTVTYLDALGTVDEHIAAVLEAKQKLIDTIVDDATPSRDERKRFTVETIDEVVSRVASHALRNAS